ncbi:MAG: phosphoglycerate mutase [Peptococcaceae bacterium BICA1-8]|nr:MAG: phosphoglycerate mutase [Peptococcaceae bacterium BICA1-8]
MIRIIFVRHGQTAWNDLGLYQGHTDVPLNKAGIEQASKAAQRLKSEKLSAIYSSDLLRAKQTAEIIAVEHNLTVNTMTEFREINFGVWEGKTYKEINETYPQLLKTWLSEPENLKIPEGETFSEMLKRVWEGLKTVLAKHQDETVILVAHGGTIGALICNILEIKLNNLWRIKQGNTGITIIEFYEEKGILTLFNDTYHLQIS